MACYNLTRFNDDLLRKHENDPPSFIVRLYPEHWTLNNGSKFLYTNNQVASLLDDIQAQRIPNDFLELFDSARVPFYDGCMIVEIMDYRPTKPKESVLEKPEQSRVILAPNAETLWSEICLLNQKAGNTWTDQDALEAESRILLATAPPLCLDPDPLLARAANSIMRVTAPAPPASLKRKAAVLEEEEDLERQRRAKIMQFMNPKLNRSALPSYHILDVLQRVRMQRAQTNATIQAAQSGQTTQPAFNPSSVPAAASAPVPVPYPIAAAAAAPVPATGSGPAPAAIPAYTHPVPSVQPVPQPTAALPHGVPAGVVAANGAIPMSTPTPPVQRTSTSPDIRRAIKRPESRQSPLATTRPSSTVPVPATHNQHFQIPAGRNTPIPPQQSHTPRPPSQATIKSSPAMAPQRPPSVIQRSPVVSVPQQQPLQPPQPASTPAAHGHVPQPNIQHQSPHPQQTQPQSQPQQQHAQHPHPQQPHPQQPNQANIQPNMNMTAATLLAAKRRQPIPAGMHAIQHNPAAMYLMQQQQAMAAAQQQRAQSAQGHGSNTPVPTPMISNQGQPRINSPMVAATPQLAARSPMPNAQQQHLGQPQQQSYNLAAVMQMRANPHFMHQYNAALQGHATAAQQGQHQNGHEQQPNAAAIQYQQMFNYPQVGVNMNVAQNRIPGGYWAPMGVGRGMVPNGQAQMAAAMAGHQQQQMPLGANRTVQGGMQGS
ncbi:hypothetical protein K474DRAFT_1620724 [Panus rudis PR-1116 ss-1]|nr:hypothetical protein K474DRAFT_1620724 [Panus rudis PR-1116 ss-1]